MDVGRSELAGSSRIGVGATNPNRGPNIESASFGLEGVANTSVPGWAAWLWLSSRQLLTQVIDSPSDGRLPLGSLVLRPSRPTRA